MLSPRFVNYFIGAAVALSKKIAKATKAKKQTWYIASQEKNKQIARKIMTLLSATTSKTFNLLSIGQRGVGKTVFLAGSYTELQAINQINSPQTEEFWFDCRDTQVQQNMDHLLGYIAQTGQYPPATMKISNFNFSLKRQDTWSEKTLCHFRWWDIPGEICDISNNRDFQRMVLTSHGCCVFIDADALVHERAYLKSLEEMMRQVMGIASLVYQRGLKYPLALIFTKCDLIQLGPISQLQIEQSVQPLITVLDSVQANYKRFYSAIPIVSSEGVSTIKAKGAAAPLLWVTLELKRINNVQLQKDLGSGLMQNSPESIGKASAVKKTPDLNLLPSIYNYILPLLLASISLLSVSLTIFLAFSQYKLGSEQAFKNQSNILPQAVKKPPDYAGRE